MLVLVHVCWCLCVYVGLGAYVPVLVLVLFVRRALTHAQYIRKCNAWPSLSGLCRYVNLPPWDLDEITCLDEIGGCTFFCVHTTFASHGVGADISRHTVGHGDG